MKCSNKNRASGKLQIVDGISEESGIANLMASKLKTTLNAHSGASRNLLSFYINSSLSTSELADICVSEDDVTDTIDCLKPHKSDPSGISTELVKNAASVVSECVLPLYSQHIEAWAIMPKCLRDSVLLPIPKSGKKTFSQ